METFKDIQEINPFVYRDGYELSRYIDDEIIQSGLRHSCKVEACTSDADRYAEPTGKILYRCDSIAIADDIELFCLLTFPRFLHHSFQSENQIEKKVSILCDDLLILAIRVCHLQFLLSFLPDASFQKPESFLFASLWNVV